jgi:tetratricopeptide (TPR) repeat protein
MGSESSKKDERERKAVEKAIEKSVKKAESSAKRGDYAEAASLYQEAARLAEAINDRRAIDFCLEEANCNLRLGKAFNVGWAYKAAAVYALDFNDFSNAINLASKALEYFSKVNSMYAVQWCYNLMGAAGEKMGDYDLAVSNYRKSLDIEYSEDIEKKINSLSATVPRLRVEQLCAKAAAKEGEKVEIALRVTNDTKDEIKDIKICGDKENELEHIALLKPGEAKTFKYTLAAWEKAKPLFQKITWKDKKGEVRERLIEPPRLCVVPNIDIRPCLKNRLEVGKQSYFVISVANNSKQPIEDIDLQVSFPVEFKVHPVTGYNIERISPGEEKGFVFKILPTITGKTVLKPVISFSDVYGRRYRKNIEAFVIEETFPPSTITKTEPPKPVDKENFDRLKYTEKFKRYLESFIHPKEMDEPEYIRLTKKLKSSIRGYTLKDVDADKVANHIIEEYKGMSLVGQHAWEGERLYMFSGEANDGGLYLLTAVAKEDDNLVHVALKLYSDKEEELDDMLEKLSDILKYTIIAMSFATEIQKIEVKETINIIDSIVQRSKIGERIRKKDKELDIKDSVVQRTDL